MINALLALLVIAQDPAGQDPVEALKKEIAQLRERVQKLEADRAAVAADNVKLREENTRLNRFTMEMAEQLGRMRQVIGDLSAKAAQVAASPEAAPVAGPAPTPPLRSRVLVVNCEYAFLIIDRGEPDGIKEDSTFDILRKVTDKTRGERYESIGAATFDKYLTTTKNRQSKLKVTRGLAADMRYDDIAVLCRPGELPAAKLDEKNPVIGKIGAASDLGGITVGVGYAQGVRVGTVFEVRRQGRTVGRIVLKEVSKSTSRAEPLGTLKVDEVFEGDFVESAD